MKIAVLAHARHPIAEPYAGGLEAHTATTVEALVRRGHQVTLFAKAGSRSPGRVVPIVSTGLTFGQAYDRAGVDVAERVLDEAYGRVLDQAAGAGFDVVLNNTLSPVPYARPLGVATLTVLHTPATLPLVDAVIDAPGWRSSPRHGFAAVSRHTTDDWRRRLPSVRCVPNGIDLTRWRPVRQAPRPRLAVWSGRITPEKGLDLAIDAARLAGWHLDVSGPVSDERYFEQVVVPRMGGPVRYLGHLRHDRLRTFLSSGSVLLFSPRWPEPFGLAAVEAMACGTPVASLPAGAAGEIIGPTSGVLATDGTAEALAEALVGAAGLDRRQVRRAALRFDQDTMISAYEALMTELVQGATQQADLV